MSSEWVYQWFVICFVLFLIVIGVQGLLTLDSKTDDHDGTGSENDACELVEMDDTVVGVTRELLPPQIVVYDEDETVIETIDADTIVQVEKTQARTVMESSVHMYGPHREQQDGDEQSRITRL